MCGKGFSDHYKFWFFLGAVTLALVIWGTS